MAEPWIRVHANLAKKPVVYRAIEALGIKRAEAVGLLVSLWGEVSQHSANGALAQFPDAQIEDWAGWSGKRGRFAAFIRGAHLDADGRVNEWDEYAGALEEQRRQARDRKRKSRGSHGDGHGDNGVTSSPTIRDETIRTEERLLRPLHAESAEVEAGLAVMLESDADRNALTVVAARAADRFACLVALQSMLTGNDPATPKPSASLFGEALRDLAANGDKPSARKFRNYLADAMRRREEGAGPPSVVRATKATGAHRDDTSPIADALAEWKRKTDEAENKVPA